jgi:hypothetical protein
LVSCSLLVLSQDKIIKHSGEKIDGKVLRVTATSVVFRYAGEDAEHQYGKLAISEIVYASGRKLPVSEKIVITGKEDWEKVEVVSDPEMVAGLKEGEELRGKTNGVFGFHTAASADRKAMRKLKELAAEAGSPVVLITKDNDARGAEIGVGGAQGLKRGLMYNYK